MDDESLGGVIAGAAALGASAINAGSQERTNRWQMKLAQYAYDQERQMIQEQNEYNSPLNQLKRYQEAGLNPNLIYGEGKASAGNQSSIAQYKSPSLNAPQVSTFGVSEAIAAMLNLKQMELNTEKTAAEVEAMRYRNQLMERYTRRQDAELTYYNLLHGDGENSPAFEDYAAGIRLKHQQFDLGELEKGYRMAVTAGQKLSNREKDFYFKNLLPLMVESKKLELEGMSYENIIKRIDAETERLFRQTSIGSNPWRAAYGLGSILGDKLGSIWRNRILPKLRSGVR